MCIRDRDEGNWQGRITGALSDEDIAVIQNYGNVKSVELNDALSDEKGTVVDITSVSYTHLDVYKRQILGISMFLLRNYNLFLTFFS